MVVGEGQASGDRSWKPVRRLNCKTKPPAPTIPPSCSSSESSNAIKQHDLDNPEAFHHFLDGGEVDPGMKCPTTTTTRSLSQEQIDLIRLNREKALAIRAARSRTMTATSSTSLT